MAFCPNCGTQANGAYCPNCGSALGSSTAGANTTNYTSGPTSTIQAPGMSENVASALCYLLGLITGIIFLIVAPYNRNRTIRFHAFQSIFLHIAFIVLSIVVSMVLSLIAVMTHGLGFALFPLIGILALLVWIYMMYTAFQGQKVKLPVIGDLAEKQA